MVVSNTYVVTVILPHGQVLLVLIALVVGEMITTPSVRAGHAIILYDFPPDFFVKFVFLQQLQQQEYILVPE